MGFVVCAHPRQACLPVTTTEGVWMFTGLRFQPLCFLISRQGGLPCLEHRLHTGCCSGITQSLQANAGIVM
jgi:hypothetical protein